MSIKFLSILAAVIGCLCIAFAISSVYVAVSIAAADPGAAAASYDSRYWWWPLSAAVVFWALAASGFISHRRQRHDVAA